MKRRRSYLKVGYMLILLMGLITVTGVAQSGEPLRFYGYFQGLARYNDTTVNVDIGPEEFLSFSIQQLNLFLYKQFDPKFSAFLDVELTNSFSTRDGFGSLKLEEAWVKYDGSQAFKIKAGLVIPTFNNLNTIKNRTPLLPYIIRPWAYETSFSNALNLNEYTPLQAAIEVSGAFKLGSDTRLNYAVYMGNQEAFISSDFFGVAPSGTDTTLTKLIGGRIGVRHKELKVGISFSSDKSDQSVFRTGVIEYEGIGTVGRMRLGADVSFNWGPVFFESEYIGIFYPMSDQKKRLLDEITGANLLLVADLSRLFAYGLIGTNIYERFFTYVTYSFAKERFSIVLKDGLGSMSFGGGYRLREQVVLKAQYGHTKTYSDFFISTSTINFMLALSVFI